MSATSTSAQSAAATGWEGAVKGLRWRLIFSIFVPIGWLSLTLLYVGFWAGGFTLFQSVILILVSLLLLGGVMGAVWVAWGPRYRHAWD